MTEEFVRMLNFEIVLLHLLRWEMLEIVRHNDVTPTPNRRRHYMAVIWVG